MPRFHVVVPFDPVIHQTLDSRVFTQLPNFTFAGGIRVQAQGAGYIAELELDASNPGAAKAAGVTGVERITAVLASWNYAFQIRTGGVRAELIQPVADASTRPTVSSGAVFASDTVFIEDHVQAVVSKASLDLENEFLRRYDELPEYVRSCLELNYLLVLSTRAPNRWLLAATGLEALAVGKAGPQPTVSGKLIPAVRSRLAKETRAGVDAAGLGALADRVVQRVLSTTDGPLADHVHDYLSRLGVTDVSSDDIGHWWRTRGRIAHGATAEIDQGELNRLISVFQTALRRTAGAEPLPGEPAT